MYYFVNIVYFGIINTNTVHASKNYRFDWVGKTHFMEQGDLAPNPTACYGSPYWL
jgi:hypothetical protein